RSYEGVPPRDGRTASSGRRRRWSDSRSACPAALEARTRRPAATKERLPPAGRRHVRTESTNQRRSWPRASRQSRRVTTDETPTFRAPASSPSVELLGHGLPLAAFHEGHVCHGMTVLQRGHDADPAVSLVLLHGFGRSSIEGPLGFGHRLALSLR